MTILVFDLKCTCVHILRKTFGKFKIEINKQICRLYSTKVKSKIKLTKNTPGARVGSGFLDRMLAVKSRNKARKKRLFWGYP